ncbi:hypothetical protein HYW87_03075 [Candidatus Roizmanbacteria bacterium]|nr:hypothetical protein [Candidatus Roizmanbacteria bacterium]
MAKKKARRAVHHSSSRKEELSPIMQIGVAFIIITAIFLFGYVFKYWTPQ